MTESTSFLGLMAMKIPRSLQRGRVPVAGLLCLASCLATRVCALAQGDREPESGLEFDSVRFFGHGDPAPAEDGAIEGGGGGAAGPGRESKKRFAISRSRFIEAQVVFENQRHAEKDAEYELTLGLYTFDNQLVSAERKQIRVAADWKFAWVSQSYGWPEAGRWSVGTYRFKVWLGEEKLGESAIYLEDDSVSLPAGVAGITVKEIEFYEGGGFFRPGPAEQAAVSFPRSKVRRIYWVLKGVNRLHRVRAQRPNVVGYYYRPDGTLLGETRNRYLIAPEIEDLVLVEGLGWPVAGEWEPGQYRFELEQDHRVVEERYFEITDPIQKPRLRPRVVHFGILDAGVFAAGESPPADAAGRSYSTRFDGAGTDRIWAELVVLNSPNHRDPHRHEIGWQLFQPDGSLLGQTVSEFAIQPEWKTARQKASFAWPEAGGWKPGAYKLRIVIDGELARILRFEIVP